MDLWGSHERQLAQAKPGSLEDDLDFRLPIDHRITENLDSEHLEQSSIDRFIPSTNIGFKMLQRMGWKGGKGLGRAEQGITEPIRSDPRDAKLGLGKQEQDDYYTAEENITRKLMDVEREETEEESKKREQEAVRVEKIKKEVTNIRKTFFCELCNKGYKLATEYETHLSSYDHNHKKRFRETQRAHKSSSEGSKDERLRREQQRQEKELAQMRQMAKAQSQQRHKEDSHSAAPSQHQPIRAHRTTAVHPSRLATSILPVSAAAAAAAGVGAVTLVPGAGLGEGIGRAAPAAPNSPAQMQEATGLEASRGGGSNTSGRAVLKFGLGRKVGASSSRGKAAVVSHPNAAAGGGNTGTKVASAKNGTDKKTKAKESVAALFQDDDSEDG